MFLDNLLESSVVELCEFGQIMDIGNAINMSVQSFQQQHVEQDLNSHITQICFQKREILFRGSFLPLTVT